MYIYHLIHDAKTNNI